MLQFRTCKKPLIYGDDFCRTVWVLHDLLLFVWRHTLFSVHIQICVPSVHSTVCCCFFDVTHCSPYTLRFVYRLSTARSVVVCLTSHTVLCTHSDLYIVCPQHGLLFVWRHTLFSVHTHICVLSVFFSYIYTTKGRDRFHWAAPPLKPYKVGDI